jgi:signal transduction histidine kinase
LQTLVQDLRALAGRGEEDRGKRWGWADPGTWAFLREAADNIHLFTSLEPVVETVPLAAWTAKKFPRILVETTSGFDESAAVTLDLAAYQRVLANLIKNAEQGDGKRGAKRIHVQIGPAPGRRHLAVSVMDDGPGMPPKLREKLDLVLTSKISGRVTTKTDVGVVHGLGLRIVRANAEALRGNVSVESRLQNPGGSDFVTRFTLELPLTPHSKGPWRLGRERVNRFVENRLQPVVRSPARYFLPLLLGLIDERPSPAHQKESGEMIRAVERSS